MFSDFSDVFRLDSAEEQHADLESKRLLSNKYILGYLLAKYAKEYEGYIFPEIATRFIEQNPLKLYLNRKNLPPRAYELDLEKASTEGKIIGDLFFSSAIPNPTPRTGDEILVDIEPQGSYDVGYSMPKKIAFIEAMRISGQQERLFTPPECQNLKPVYSFWICLNPPLYAQNRIRTSKMTLVSDSGLEAAEVEDFLGNMDHSKRIEIFLGDRDKTDNVVLRLFDTIFSVDISLEEKVKILIEDFCIPVSDELKGDMNAVGEICSSYVKRGIQKGRLQDIQSLIKNLGFTADQAIEALDIAKDERPGYLELLKEQNADV